MKNHKRMDQSDQSNTMYAQIQKKVNSTHTKTRRLYDHNMRWSHFLEHQKCHKFGGFVVYDVIKERGITFAQVVVFSSLFYAFMLGSFP